MMNRYSAEIHINPIRFLRNDDFNNDGRIQDINGTLNQAIELTENIEHQLRDLQSWIQKSNVIGSIQFHYADGGYISIKGLSDTQLLELEKKGLIELFDFATDKIWVKKYGKQFGLVWEDGKAVAI